MVDDLKKMGLVVQDHTGELRALVSYGRWVAGSGRMAMESMVTLTPPVRFENFLLAREKRPRSRTMRQFG
jgi:hypothetical protein